MLNLCKVFSLEVRRPKFASFGHHESTKQPEFLLFRQNEPLTSSLNCRANCRDLRVEPRRSSSVRRAPCTQQIQRGCSCTPSISVYSARAQSQMWSDIVDHCLLGFGSWSHGAWKCIGIRKDTNNSHGSIGRPVAVIFLLPSANAVSLACCVRPLAQPVAGRCPFCGIFTSPFGGWSWLRCDCCGVPSFKCCTWFVLGEVSESGSRLPEIFRDVKI